MDRAVKIIDYLSKNSPGDWERLRKAVGLNRYDDSIISVPRDYNILTNENGQIVDTNRYSKFIHKCISVNWRDSNMWDGQVFPDKLEEPVTEIVTYGYCTNITNDSILIARDFIGNVDGQDEYRSLIAIPIENIKIIRKLKIDWE